MTIKRTIFVVAAIVVATGLMIPAISTPQGANAVAAIQSFLEFYSGAISLVAFSGAVVWGLIAAERIVPVRYRVLGQGVHRMLGMLGLGFLATHILLQVLAERARLIDAVVPFLDTRDEFVAVGLGTIAGDLMIVVFAVGTVRGRFAAASRPWVWRAIHGAAYVCWPLSIIHGLIAGRSPAAWVTWSYVVCMCAVLVGVLVRLANPLPGTRSAARERPEPAERPQPRPQAQAAQAQAQAAQARERVQPRVQPREQPQRHDRTQPHIQPAGPIQQPEPIRVPVQRRVPPQPRVPAQPQTPIRPAVQPQTGPQPRIRPEPTGVPAQPRVSPQPVSEWQTGPQPRVQPEPTVVQPQPHKRSQSPHERAQHRRRPLSHKRRGARQEPGFAEQHSPARRPRPLPTPDEEEIEFWASLRAETAGWIRRRR